MKRLALAVAAVAVGLFAYMATQRPSQEVLWGDEGTYVAMTASLARDLDLSFDEADRAWALERVPDKGVAVILQRVGGSVAYSKPLLYPLLAAPAYKVFGETGMLLLNVLGLGAGLLLAWVYLERVAGAGHGSLMLAVLGGASAMLPYLLWRMSEALQVGLALGGTVLICGAMTARSPNSAARWHPWLEGRWAPAVGGALLGLLISMRVSNAALAGGAVLACLLMRRWRRAVTAAVGAALALGAILLVTQLAVGTASPYTAERTSFNAGIGYPTGDASPESEAALARFDQRPATHRLGLGVGVDTLFSTYYFIAGRHTGLLPYFPLALVMLWMLARRRDKIGLGLLAGVVALTLFYLLYMPNNYFGGSTFLGNRYFLVAYPVLIVGLRRLPSPRALTAVAAVALAFGFSAAISVHRTRDLPGASQSHTTSGLFRWLPYESTAVDIQGHRSRFWSRDYVRFTDPHAKARVGHFTLRSDRPPAEIMIASRLARETMTLLVRSRGSAAVLAWSDWRSAGRLEIPSGSTAGEPSRLELIPSRPWRRHPFWFQNDDAYDVRVLRLALREGEGGPVSADVYYLGDAARLGEGYEREVLDSRVPATAPAGAQSVVGVRVRNLSTVTWRQHDVLPVLAGYRLLAEDLELASQHLPLPADIAPGEAVELELQVTWPEAPGEYLLILDLALHPVGWFAEKNGEPLVSRLVRVEATEPPPS